MTILSVGLLACFLISSIAGHLYSLDLHTTPIVSLPAEEGDQGIEREFSDSKNTYPALLPEQAQPSQHYWVSSHRGVPGPSGWAGMCLLVRCVRSIS
ncbi:hypothetical protein F4680DRAFT_412745, partial [Xylaria scruposa]